MNNNTKSKLFSKISIGTAQFGMKYGITNSTGQTGSEQVSSILNFAKLNKIEKIDTAPAYGNAEEILGQNKIDQFKVVSKFMPESLMGSIENQLNKTLIDLQLEKIHGYIAHRPQDLLINKDVWPKLIKLKEDGKINKIGVSLNFPSELENLISAGFIPEIVQAPFNYFDQRFRELFIELKKNGCEVQTRSTFLQGVLLSKPDSLPDYFNEIKEELIILRMKYPENLASKMLNATLSLDFVDTVVIGVESLMQLEEILGGVEFDESIELCKISISENIIVPAFWPQKG